MRMLADYGKFIQIYYVVPMCRDSPLICLEEGYSVLLLRTNEALSLEMTDILHRLIGVEP